MNANRASGWGARASYTWVHTWASNPTDITSNSPGHLAKVNATMPLWRRASAGLEVLYSGAQTNYQGVRIGSGLLTNVTVATRPLWGGWQFSASCYNVFNRPWATPTGPDVPEPAIVQDGRGYRFKITYRIPLKREGEPPMRYRWRWGWWVVLAALSIGLLGTRAWAQHEERSVRAAFVYNLTRYVEWPHPGKELVLGFVGDDGVGETLQKVLAGKSSPERPIRVVISPSDDELQRCDLVYVGYSSKEKIRSVLEKVRDKNILSVGESDRFAGEGGMVGLVRVGDEIQIQVNLDEVQAAGLKISSRLLNLAVIARNRGGK